MARVMIVNQALLLLATLLCRGVFLGFNIDPLDMITPFSSLNSV